MKTDPAVALAASAERLKDALDALDGTAYLLPSLSPDVAKSIRAARKAVTTAYIRTSRA